MRVKALEKRNLGERGSRGAGARVCCWGRDGGRRGCGWGEGVLPSPAAARGPALRAGSGPLPPPAPARLSPAPYHLPPPWRFVFVFLQGGALPAGVETMVLTLAESWPVLVGRRFLSLSAADRGDGGLDSGDVARVAEWPWLSGTIRAVSHADVTTKDLKVKLGAGGRTSRGPLRPPRDGQPVCGRGDRKVRRDGTWEVVPWSCGAEAGVGSAGRCPSAGFGAVRPRLGAAGAGPRAGGVRVSPEGGVGGVGVKLGRWVTFAIETPKPAFWRCFQWGFVCLFVPLHVFTQLLKLLVQLEM